MQWRGAQGHEGSLNPLPSGTLRAALRGPELSQMPRSVLTEASGTGQSWSQPAFPGAGTVSQCEMGPLEPQTPASPARAHAFPAHGLLFNTGKPGWAAALTWACPGSTGHRHRG